MPRSALAVVSVAVLPIAALFAACADAPPPPPAPPPVTIAPASAVPVASAAPSASASAEVAQPKKQRPPPVACPPPKGYAPVSYLQAHGERRGPHGFAVFTGPRFSTTDPDLAPSLADVQATIDRWIEGKTGAVSGCKQACSVSAFCEVTRDDGEYLSLVCDHDFYFAEWRGGSDRQGFMFRREGKRFVPVTVQSFAREKDQSFLFRILPTWDVDVEKPLADEQDLGSFYVALHDDRFQLGTAAAFDPFPRMFPPFSVVAHHLTCDALLDFPSGPPATPSVESGALALATHIDEEDDPAVASYWFGRASSVMRTRFVAMDPRHAAAAKMLNDAVAAYLEKLRDRVKAEGWTGADATCRAYTSTNRLVSVLCYGGGNVEDGSTRTARGSITIRLTDPPQRLTGADLFAAKPAAPREIAKRCLGRFVRKPKDKDDDEVLKALPKLTAADLGDFALLQGGVMFDVEYDLAGKRRLMPCYVPNEVLGTSAKMLALPGKKK
ncbi:MAG: hypothetical protein QM820_37825 [Minicystis sp.]